MEFKSQSTLNQISPGSFSPPTDVTLKLSDGSINTHKMILAAVSPVFERMFYGHFKEGESKKVDLPMDNYKMIKLLIDFIYSGSVELDCLTEFISLMEVADRYQINKVPLKQLFGECVLSKLDSSNYSVLLSPFANSMTEESCSKAANKVVSYTESNLRQNFKRTKELPEEIILPLLQCSDIDCSESELFYFLVDWYKYQTDVLEKSLKRTPQIFRCVRYSLIIPQILSSKVVSCDLVDTRLLAKAYHYIYSSCRPLGQYCAVDDRQLVEQCSRKVVRSLKVDWFVNDGVSMTYDEVKLVLLLKSCPPSQYWISM